MTDTKQVEEIRQREMDITKEKIQRILATGARVILTTKGIDDLCLKYFVEVRVRGNNTLRPPACGSRSVISPPHMLWVAFDAPTNTRTTTLTSCQPRRPLSLSSPAPQAGAIAVRRVKPEDIKRIAKATGGQVVVTMADMEGDEAFDANALGEVRPS